MPACFRAKDGMRRRLWVPLVQPLRPCVSGVRGKLMEWAGELTMDVERTPQGVGLEYSRPFVVASNRGTFSASEPSFAHCQPERMASDLRPMRVNPIRLISPFQLHSPVYGPRFD